MSKKQKFLEKFEREANKLLTKNNLSFDEKRKELTKLFERNNSIGKNQRQSLEEYFFGTHRHHLEEQIVDEYELNKFVKPEELQLFISFVGVDFFRVNQNNIKKKLKAFEDYRKTAARDSLSKKTIEEVFSNFHQHAMARRLKRKVIYHAGPTNSGKTWGGMQALIKAKSGCYLAPLRLLAWEKYEELSPHHITALVTGEESNRPEGYTHTASTIEMANYRKKFDVAVIDEIQMIGDDQRGWSWTKALISIQADVVYLCGDASAIDLVQKITTLCGDDLEIVHHERKSTLTYIEHPIQERDVQKGDAIVVFSRREALSQKENFEKAGFKVSIIYGLMTPEVRKEQARLFLEGKTDIVISTDAIGMGLNLPIRRVIFSTIVKYYDKQEFVISPSEIKQIAGRAGRFGLYPEGFVGLLDQKYNKKWTFKKHLSEKDLTKEINSDNYFMKGKIKGALQQTLAPLQTAIIGPDFDVLQHLNAELQKQNHSIMNVLEFLYVFNKIKTNELFTKANIKDLVAQAEMIHYDISKEIQNDVNSLENIFKFVVAPVMQQQEDHVEEFQRLYSNYFAGVDSFFRKYGSLEFLDSCEMDLKAIELYQWVKNQFDEGFASTPEEITKSKNTLIDRINTLLIKIKE